MNDISEELLRIGEQIERIARREADSSQAPEGTVTSRDIQRIISARRLRSEFFPASYFSDPGWEILLALFAAELEGVVLTMSQTYQRAGIADTTGLRWVTMMIERGTIMRRNDPEDKRMVDLALTPKTSRQMRAYFDRVWRSLARPI